MLPPDINASELAFTVVQRRRAVRPRRGQERRRGRDRSRCSRSARSCGRIDSLLHALRGPRPAAGQQARVREPGQGRRVRLARRRAPARAVACSAPGCSPPSTARSSTAAATSATARRGRRSCSAAPPSDADDGRSPAVPLPDAPPWTESQQLAGREGDARPLQERPPDRALRARPDASSARAASPSSPGPNPTSGWPASSSGLRPLKTRKGDRMAVFTLEDATAASRSSSFRRRSASTAASSRPTRWCSSAASSRKTTSRRGCWRPSSLPIDGAARAD